GLILSQSSLTLTGSLIVGCGPSHYLSCYSCDVGSSYAYARSIEAHGEVQFESNTFVDNPIVDWYMGQPTVMGSPEIYIPLIDLGDGVTGTISHNLFIGQTGPAVSGPASVVVSCNDAWQSQTELWTGGMGNVTGTNGNISQAPTFCSREEGDYTLSVHSAAATASCGLMGAFPTACEKPVPVAIQDFSAHWVSSGVQLQWEIATQNPAVAIVERLDAEGLKEIYRGGASSFLDPTPPADGPLQYALGLVLDGQEMSGLSWVKAAGTPPRPRPRLLEARPNPFNPSTTIRFELERATHAKLQVFSLSGRLVATLVDGECQAGMNEVTWQGRDSAQSAVSSGVYLYTLRVGRYLETKRMVLLK
ncbi:MAG TPA: T9SS type A sorting domain-containing protein, partial [Candidatus Krumholzibacteria bacterium]|nr:T9SS type A sorting domain-containing protein [Candidatus Krumholzibacteria bacterium]